MESLDPNMLKVAALLAGYFLGSIPWGLVLTRVFTGTDIRDIGSGNIGATNVLRTGNKLLAFLTLILDASKGAVAAIVFLQFGHEPGLIAGGAAVLGHNFPIWLKFKGGKGVATTLGMLIAVSWPVGVLSCAAWLLTAGTFRYSSLASMVSLAVAPFFAHWFVGDQLLTWIAGGLAVIALVRHKENIKRLVKGQETKIGHDKSDEMPPSK